MSRKYNISGFPTLLFFEKGELQYPYPGGNSKEVSGRGNNIQGETAKRYQFQGATAKRYQGKQYPGGNSKEVPGPGGNSKEVPGGTISKGQQQRGTSPGGKISRGPQQRGTGKETTFFLIKIIYSFPQFIEFIDAD